MILVLKCLPEDIFILRAPCRRVRHADILEVCPLCTSYLKLLLRFQPGTCHRRAHVRHRNHERLSDGARTPCTQPRHQRLHIQRVIVVAMQIHGFLLLPGPKNDFQRTSLGANAASSTIILATRRMTLGCPPCSISNCCHFSKTWPSS